MNKLCSKIVITNYLNQYGMITSKNRWFIEIGDTCEETGICLTNNFLFCLQRFPSKISYSHTHTHKEKHQVGFPWWLLLKEKNIHKSLDIWKFVSLRKKIARFANRQFFSKLFFLIYFIYLQAIFFLHDQTNIQINYIFV